MHFLWSKNEFHSFIIICVLLILGMTYNEFFQNWIWGTVHIIFHLIGTTVCSPNFGNVIPLRISISNDQIMVRAVEDRKNVCLVIILKLDISSFCISCGETPRLLHVVEWYIEHSISILKWWINNYHKKAQMFVTLTRIVVL